MIETASLAIKGCWKAWAQSGSSRQLKLPWNPKRPTSEERHSALPQTYEAKPRCSVQDTNPKGPMCCYGGYFPKS